jgi:hypothetical protein
MSLYSLTAPPQQTAGPGGLSGSHITPSTRARSGRSDPIANPMPKHLFARNRGSPGSRGPTARPTRYFYQGPTSPYQ